MVFRGVVMACGRIFQVDWILGRACKVCFVGMANLRKADVEQSGRVRCAGVPCQVPVGMCSVGVASACRSLAPIVLAVGLRLRFQLAAVDT